MESKSKPLVIGGRDYTLAELCSFPVHDLAELIVDYQDTRRTWQAADDAIAACVGQLEAELAATRRDLVRKQAELRRERRVAKARSVRKATRVREQFA